MAKKTHVKVRLVPEAKPDSPFFYYVKKPAGGEKAKVKLSAKKYNPATRKHEINGAAKPVTSMRACHHRCISNLVDRKNKQNGAQKQKTEMFQTVSGGEPGATQNSL